jgi:hypothetical protein
MLGFDQFFDVSRPQPGWQVFGKGGSEQAGYYTVGAVFIVSHYNKCVHQRSQLELDMMGALHFAFRAGNRAKALDLLEQARMGFPPCAKGALDVYAIALGVQVRADA